MLAWRVGMAQAFIYIYNLKRSETKLVDLVQIEIEIKTKTLNVTENLEEQKKI